MTLPETLNTHSIPGSLSSLKFPCTDFWLIYLGMLLIIFLSPIRRKLTCLVHYFTPTPRWETASQTELQNPMAEGASEHWLKCEGSWDGNDPEQVLGLSLMKGWHCCDCNNNVLLFWREREEAAQQAALSVGCSEGGEEGKQLLWEQDLCHLMWDTINKIMTFSIKKSDVPWLGFYGKHMESSLHQPSPRLAMQKFNEPHRKTGRKLLFLDPFFRIN